MRKLRDYDSELKALDDKAKQLRARKLLQLGELVIACGADTLPVEQLAGVLIAAAEVDDVGTKEAWRRRGSAFFQGARGAGRQAGCGPRRNQENAGGEQPGSGAAST